MNVEVKATRIGEWWALEVDYGTGLSTQVRRLDLAEAMAADAVSLASGVWRPSSGHHGARRSGPPGRQAPVGR